MKYFLVEWEESFSYSCSVVIDAESKEQAKGKWLSGQFDENDCIKDVSDSRIEAPDIDTIREIKQQT